MLMFSCPVIPYARHAIGVMARAYTLAATFMHARAGAYVDIHARARALGKEYSITSPIRTISSAA